MLVVGLTGGIGSGKSLVANLFAKLGVPIIDADVIARDITQPNYSAYPKIVSYFGQSILLENKELDRKKLREIIFQEVEKRLWLENLLHPLIIQELQNQILKTQAIYCIVVIPLLLETNSYTFLDRILVIDTSYDLQKKRVLERDNISSNLIDNILYSQANREERLAIADDVIENNHDPQDLIPKVAKLHEYYIEQAASI